MIRQSGKHLLGYEKIQVREDLGFWTAIPKTPKDPKLCPRCGSHDRNALYGESLDKDPIKKSCGWNVDDAHPWHWEGERCPVCRSDSPDVQGWFPREGEVWNEDQSNGENCKHPWHNDTSVVGIPHPRKM